MRKTIQKTALALLCVGALSAANAAVSYITQNEENIRNAQTASASPLRLSSDKHALAFHKMGSGRGSISFFDKTNPGIPADRYYVLGAYGVAGNTTLYYQNGQSPYYYSYGAYTSSANVSSTRVGGYYSELKSSDTTNVTFYTSSIDSLIARAKKAGYYKIRFTVDSIASKLPSHPTYGGVAGYSNSKSVATYYMYYVLPATGTAYISSKRGTVNASYTAANAVTSITFPYSKLR